MVSKSKIDQWIENEPLLKTVMEKKPVSWINPNRKLKKDFPNFPVSLSDMEEAAKLWDRFAPFFMEAFPETQAADGILESPLVEISKMKALLEQDGNKVEGKLFLKCDNSLPIVGSIKARGGFFEVLHYAETLATREGLISKESDYADFHSEKFRKFFSKYQIGVGSTGNLGSVLKSVYGLV